MVACDMPDIGRDQPADAAPSAPPNPQANCVAASGPTGEPEPLCAVYHRRCLPALDRALRDKRLKMKDLLPELQLESVAFPAAALANVNTPEEWTQFQPSMTDKLHYIEFRHVYKTFDHPVLVDVNFYVNAGETLAIIGRSGVGKSVSLGHIMGFLKPDRAASIVAYQDITDFAEAATARDPQESDHGVPVRRAVRLAHRGREHPVLARAARGLRRAEQGRRGERPALHGGSCWSTRDAYPADLSTGYKRAVAIARALAAQPQCILYDEPTTMVDPIMSDHLTRPDAAAEEPAQADRGGGDARSGPDAQSGGPRGVAVRRQAIYFGPVADLEKSEHPHIREFLAMDRVELV